MVLIPFLLLYFDIRVVGEYRTRLGLVVFRPIDMFRVRKRSSTTSLGPFMHP